MSSLLKINKYLILKTIQEAKQTTSLRLTEFSKSQYSRLDLGRKLSTKKSLCRREKKQKLIFHSPFLSSLLLQIKNLQVIHSALPPTSFRPQQHPGKAQWFPLIHKRFSGEIWGSTLSYPITLGCCLLLSSGVFLPPPSPYLQLYLVPSLHSGRMCMSALCHHPLPLPSLEYIRYSETASCFHLFSSDQTHWLLVRIAQTLLWLWKMKDISWHMFLLLRTEQTSAVWTRR